HVTPSIGDHIDDDPPVEAPIDHAVRLEEDLAVFLNSERAELTRMDTAIGRRRKIVGYLDKTIEDVVGLLARVMFCDVRVDVFEVALRILREQNFETHQSPAVRSRRRFTTSATGLTSPCATCRLPRARIFSSASVS